MCFANEKRNDGGFHVDGAINRLSKQQISEQCVLIQIFTFIFQIE